MLFRKSPGKFWNLMASKYAASPINDREAYERKIQAIKSYLSADNNVLDIGCATGTQCIDIAGDVNRVTGIDISNKLLSIAEQRRVERNIVNVKFIETTVFDKRFQPQSFDVVMAFYVLHFIEDIDEIFERIHELLKPGAWFIFETACIGEKNKIMGKIIRLAGYIGILPLINLLTYDKLESALDKAGFILVDKTKFGNGRDAEFTLIVRKKPEA